VATEGLKLSIKRLPVFVVWMWLMERKAPGSGSKKYLTGQVADAPKAAAFSAVEHTQEKGYYIEEK
jgi:hypothetical protein